MEAENKDTETKAEEIKKAGKQPAQISFARDCRVGTAMPPAILPC